MWNHYSAVYESIDRCKSWKEIGLPHNSCDNILLANDKIFVSGINSFFLSSNEDKNGIWDPQIIYPIGRIGRTSANNIISVGSGSPYPIWIYDSTLTAGWKRRSSIEKIEGEPIIVSDNKFTYLSSGLNLFQSDDNALTWVTVNPPNTGNSIYSLDVAIDGTVYFGSVPAMYRSDNHGATWTKLHPINDPIKLTYIKAFGASSVLLGTEGDGLLLSNDKGNNWLRIDEKNFDTVTCIAIDSRGEIAVGTNRGLWLLDSGRHSWTKVTLGNDADLYIGGIDVSKDDDFCIGTHGSSVWKGTRNYNSVSTASAYNSSMEISPNPASTNIKISFDPENAKLELYDMLGRKLSVIADGNISTAQFNTANLANGIYTVVLTSDKKRETQRVVVNH
jgi:photosystem II stability/assembly factor-like uncharacterized protein